MAIETGAILIVDDDADILMAGKLLLQRHYHRVDICADPAQIPMLMAKTDYAAILLDMNFGPGESTGEQGFHWLGEILGISPDVVVVLITAHGGVDVAVKGMKIGATDFISKPWQNEKVVATLSASVKLSQTRSEAKQLKQANSALVEVASQSKQPMLGQSPAMQTVLTMIERAAPTDANVLLLGENGTGKELAARALHQQSNRRDQIFMTVDLAAVTESLFESELFGHMKGAFTGANQNRVGRLQASNGGTLFLDEVGNVPLHLQAKLLSVLEQRQVSPVGSTRPVEIDIRVIAATNLPKAQLTNEDRFRQDLLFRLNTVEILIPPLRDRRSDIPVIAEHFANLYFRKYNKKPKAFSRGAMQAIVGYHWPGNVRALRHAVERAVILSGNIDFQAGDFQLEEEHASPINQVREENKREDQQASHERANAQFNLEMLEKRAIEQALRRNRYNISYTAKDLGLTRAALYRRMEKHGL
ncbi:MAG: sigma-54 dependent transcriptional regulator [Gammaproteobacteria bacterium]|nr:sigma-54 dependent transcriptional regulator [Gammaproteobacteria bacterium]